MAIRLSAAKRLGENGLELTWNDGRVTAIPSKALRERCPCASCRERRGDTSHAAPLTPRPASSLLKVVTSSSVEEERLTEIWAVGGYALGMRWGDGHSSGIYTYDYLDELSAHSS